MTLNKFNIKVTFNEERGEISSVKFFDQEALYQGDQTWKKTFPICFPNLSYSRKYKYENEAYTLPKHGFWANLDWKTQLTKGRIVAKAQINHPNYPFQLGITQQISISQNYTVTLRVAIENIGYQRAYFHFGFHPAFKIEPQSFLFFGKDIVGHWINDKGQLTTKRVELTENVPVASLDFAAEKHNTIFVEDYGRGKVMLENAKYSIWFKIRSKHLQLWKHPDDDFICIEPWNGVQDDLYEYIGDVTKKRDIIWIDSHKVYKTKFKMRFDDIEDYQKKE